MNISIQKIYQVNMKKTLEVSIFLVSLPTLCYCVIPQFDWLCDVCGCVMSPTLGIYWVDLGFINNYKEPQLWLVLLRYSADVVSAFPWVVTTTENKSKYVNCGKCIAKTPTGTSKLSRYLKLFPKAFWLHHSEILSARSMECRRC